LELDDTLILYTDGITEAVNPEDEEYGLDRLADLCREHRSQGLAELAETIESELDAFVRGVPYADDRTVVMARRIEGAGP
jgi:sigma-B regulation protein RsbU (phosphoserine phosphatase)